VAEALDPSGSEVRLGELVLRTRGFAGTAELTGGPQATGARAATPGDGLLAPALEGAEVTVQHEIELTEFTREPGVPVDVRTDAGEPAIELLVPDVAEGWGQMILATDEAGIGTWHFEPKREAETRALRGLGTRLYRVRAPSPSAPAGPATRGVLVAAGRALVRVLAFRLLDAASARAGEHLASSWEKRRRPYRLRAFGPEDYLDADPPAFDVSGWQRVGDGRALMFLHGTFSRAHTGFCRLPHDTLEQLHSRYGQRVFAFDHFTLSEDPWENAEWLIAAMPEDIPLDLDIVCHSRGGLVARALAERQSEISLGSRQLKIKRIVFAGTPNAGTVLADFEHFGDLIDSYTTLLSFVPDNGVTDILETVITVAKTIAVGATRRLVGLTAMTPGGEFLKALNAATGSVAQYFGLASDYEPTVPALKDWVRHRLASSLFASEANDLVVPAMGVFAESGSALFPIAGDRLFKPPDGVTHGDYFNATTGSPKLLDWLPG